MQSWQYEINDVLRIRHKEQEVLARVADYEDSLDNTTPLYVNLRVSDGLRWGERKVKIQASQIIEALPNWYIERDAAFEASIKATVDKVWPKMSDYEKRRVHEQAIELGIVQERDTRSPIERMIDSAVKRVV